LLLPVNLRQARGKPITGSKGLHPEGQRPLDILTLRDRVIQWTKLMAGMRPLKLRGNIKLPSK